MDFGINIDNAEISKKRSVEVASREKTERRNNEVDASVAMAWSDGRVNEKNYHRKLASL